MLNYNLPFFASVHPTYAVYTFVSGNKGASISLPLTLPNADRFSKFFHGQTWQ